MSWDLLRTFESVARLGTLTAAARALGVSQSTVSRQLSQLEGQAGSPLFVRETPLRLTEKGESLLSAVKPMVTSALAAQSALEESPKLSGEVTLTTVGELVRWVLSRELLSFYREYPHLRLRILADNRISSLAAGDADIALRFLRPTRGELVGRRLHSETYGLFASPQFALHREVAWLGLAGSLSNLPEQRFAQAAFANRPARLLVEDLETLAAATEQGLGVAILPHSLAARMAGLREVLPQQVGALDQGPIPARDLWMVVHRKRQRLPKVRAVMTWLGSLPAFNRQGPRGAA